METYIIRIYRHEKKCSDRLVGILEKTGSIEQRVFSNFEELWDFMEEVGKEKRKELKKDAPKHECTSLSV